MTVTAAIKFVQGSNVGVAGVALVADPAQGTTVDLSNADDVSGPVVRWKYTILGVPTGSAVAVGLVSDGPISTATFDWDLPGGYHVELVVFDAAGAQDVDRREFLVLESSGRKIPAFDSEAPALNFSNGRYGWQPIMEEWLKFVDGQAPLANNGTGTLNDVPTKASARSVYGLSFTNGGGASVTGLASGYAGQRLYVTAAGGASVVLKNQDAGSSAVNRIITGTGADVAVQSGAIVQLVYDGTTTRWRLLAGAGSGGGGTPGGADKDVQINDAAAFGADTGNFTYDKVLHALAAGLGSTATAAQSCAIGSSCLASGTDSVALGVSCTASGTAAFAAGDTCTATAVTACALGESAHAPRQGELAHSSQGNLGYEGLHAIDLAGEGNAAPVDIVMGDLAELALDDLKVVSMRVRIVASKVGAAVRAHEVHELLIAANGTLTIDEDDILTNAAVNFASKGWTLTISNPASRTLRFHCDPGADDVKFMARVEWAALPGS